MVDLERIWNATPEQLKAGYVEIDEQYVCLCCGEAFTKGVIYPVDGVLYEAWKMARQHIVQAHQSVFACLISLDKSVTGLSDLQRRLLALFYQGKSDAEVQKELGIGAASTIRNHRFLLRERERQAKLFQAIMALLRGRDAAAPAGGQRAAAERPSADEKVLKKYFPAGPTGPLKSLAIPAKHRSLILGVVAGRFEGGRTYPEAEVNQVLEPVWADYVTLRRYLVDDGLLTRTADGSRYWRSNRTDGGEGRRVDRKRELKQLAREMETEAGVYRIANSRNGKVLVESTRNLKTLNGQRFQLETGAHPNKELQREWNEFGPEAFVLEVLEVLERPETGPFDEKDGLKKLKERWLERLQPFGERGYNAVKERSGSGN